MPIRRIGQGEIDVNYGMGSACRVGMTGERLPELRRCLLAEAGGATLRQWLDDPRHGILWVVASSCGG